MAYEADNPEIKKLLQDLGRRLAADMPAGWGFTLMLFEFGRADIFYFSSARTADMISAMKEFLRNKGETSL